MDARTFQNNKFCIARPNRMYWVTTLALATAGSCCINALAQQPPKQNQSQFAPYGEVKTAQVVLGTEQTTAGSTTGMQEQHNRWTNADGEWPEPDPAGRKAQIEQVSKKIAQDPSAANFRERARLYMIIYDWAQSESDASRAISLDPQDADAWSIRGLDRCELRRFREAIQDLDKALSLAKRGDWVYINTLRTRCNCYVYLEDPKHAYADEQTLVDLGVEPASHLNLPDWQSQKRLSDLDPAAKSELEKLNQAVAKDPTAANYAVRAVFYRNHYMSSEAIADDSRAIELDPTVAFGWMSRGGDKCQLGLYKEGLLDLNKALSLATYGDKIYIGTLNARLDCYLHLGDKKGAYADLQTLVKLGAGKAKYLNEPCLH